VAGIGAILSGREQSRFRYRTCRELAGFDPDIRHRTNDSVTCLAVVAHCQAVALLGWPT
jgi:hypothetical protein